MRRHDHAVSKFAVSRNPNLPGEDGIPAYLGRPCQPYLCAKQTVGTDLRAVPYLDQVVDFHPRADACFSHAGAVNCRVGLDFHVVFDDGRPRLHDLVPDARVILGKSEAVAAYDNAVLENDIVTDLAVLADNRVRMGVEIVADAGVGIDDHMRQQCGVVADGRRLR